MTTEIHKDTRTLEEIISSMQARTEALKSDPEYLAEMEEYEKSLIGKELCPLTDDLKDDGTCCSCDYEYDEHCWFGEVDLDVISDWHHRDYLQAVCEDNAWRDQ